jgi:hypothetical protein
MAALATTWATETTDAYARAPTPAITAKLKSTSARAIHALTAAYASRLPVAMCAHVCLVLPAFDANLQSTIAARVHAVISVFAIAYRTDSRARACLDILAFCATYQLTIVTRIHAKTELRVQAVCHCPTCTFADARQDFMVITARFSLIHAV